MSELIYKQDKTRQDVEELLMQHKNLLYARLTAMGQLRNQDAESAGWEALWDSIETFDIYGTVAFSTYAYRCITNAINNVLRKQQAERSKIEFCELTEANTLFTDTSYESAETLRIVSEAFDEYTARTRSCLATDILQLWRASGYSLSATEIARQVGSSASYVTRVQSSFRAYLSGRLKG